jgi:hypothetical protein
MYVGNPEIKWTLEGPVPYVCLSCDSKNDTQRPLMSGPLPGKPPDHSEKRWINKPEVEGGSICATFRRRRALRLVRLAISHLF